MCGTSSALQMDCTALEDELCEGPKIATTPKDSWSQARKGERLEGIVCSTSHQIQHKRHRDHCEGDTFPLLPSTERTLVLVSTTIHTQTQSESLTFPRRLKTVVDIDPLYVICECCVWQQSPVSVNVIDGELEGELLGANKGNGSVCLFEDPT